MNPDECTTTVCAHKFSDPSVWQQDGPPPPAPLTGNKACPGALDAATATVQRLGPAGQNAGGIADFNRRLRWHGRQFHSASSLLFDNGV